MNSKIIFSLAIVLTLLVPFNSFGHESKTPNFIFQNTKINTNKVYEEYAALDQALVKDNADSAQIAATNLVAALTSISDSTEALTTAIAISHTKNISEQRKSFALLTKSLYKILKANKPEKMLYIHYCPMAKAYWMDESKSIANPYYGKAMPTCGKTTGMIM